MRLFCMCEEEESDLADRSSRFPVCLKILTFQVQSKVGELPPDEQAPGEDAQTSELSGLFVLKPESATATKGKDITFMAKVDSSTLLRKPTMKWLKGKWLDLGSKAGKHLQFKETYDRNTKSLVPRG
ncbi:Myosin-binding protein C, slow-type [Collichthys lucidus]|uniref:Myosin-binding protein C, slow-type n=1 Tax=Collichthys lucidus TaxID=240159 RepID=A0A4U5VT36_COLLU|nr:Myosin-binding protein C, slow-type [Collichthys lucidus]